MENFKFGLIGAAGYIAPRHMEAIYRTGNELVAALDKADSVGQLDKYFPNTHFFTELERFDRHIYKLSSTNKPLDYISICSPNYLHDSHIRFSMRNGANVICEKPLVLNPWNLDILQDFERDSRKRIFTILQLRLHPEIIALKKQVEENPNKMYELDLTYITSRGNWYMASWKGDETKSGGLVSNIGIHFFDMLSWIFGPMKLNIVHTLQRSHAGGFLQLQQAKIRWFLSISADHLPNDVRARGQRTFRSITIDGQEIEFSEGFTDLHTRAYEDILQGKGFGVEDARRSIEIAFAIRSSQPVGLQGDYNEILHKI